MKITDNFDITRHNNNTYHWFVNGVAHFTTPSDKAEYDSLEQMYNALKATPPSGREALVNQWVSRGLFSIILGNKPSAKVDFEAPAPTITVQERLVRGISNLMNFFTEFDFTPSFRFTNTLSFQLATSEASARNYIINYFRLMDSSYIAEITEKMKSGEFKNILADIKCFGSPATPVNDRLKIYFGSAGTGKTTIAQEESENRCIVCNNSMLPADLMEDFKFIDGHPEFSPSTLWDCMENGKVIVFDEINLLPFDSLRFLQGICDGKREFSYKNRTVKIADGFKIIGTMNLTLGGMNYGLPEPLVDRCADIKEFTLTAKQLAKAIMG